MKYSHFVKYVPACCKKIMSTEIYIFQYQCRIAIWFFSQFTVNIY